MIIVLHKSLMPLALLSDMNILKASFFVELRVQTYDFG